MDEVERLFTVSKQAQLGWAHLPIRKRAGRLLTLRETLINHTEDFLGSLPSGQGEAFPTLVGELLASVEQITYSAKVLPKELSSHLSRSFNLLLLHQKTLVHHHPLGVVLLVGSGDFPLLSILSRLAPALISGNSVILVTQAPSPIHQKIVEMCLEAGLPTDLVQSLVLSDGQFEELFQQAPAKVFYWGPHEPSKKLLAAAAESRIPVQADLLPSRVTVVLADADLDFASSAVLSSASGPSSAETRQDALYLHERVADAFAAQIRIKLENLPGAAKNPRLLRLGDASRAIRFMGVTDLAGQINALPSPLQVSVFSKNLHLAHDVGRQIRAAAVFVNDEPYSAEAFALVPQDFVRTQKIRLPKLSLLLFKAPWWLPHTPFQFEAFKTYLDLYRRHLTARLRAVPLLLWNLIQMFKNERRL